MNDVSDFALWLTQELDRRGWSRSEAARRAKLSPSILDKVIGGYSKPGEKLCRGLARAFGMPVEEVFRIAGILPATSSAQHDVVSLIARLNEMPPALRQETVTLLNLIVDYRQAAGAQTPASRNGLRRRKPGLGVTLSDDPVERRKQVLVMLEALPENELKEAAEELARLLADRPPEAKASSEN